MINIQKLADVRWGENKDQILANLHVEGIGKVDVSFRRHMRGWTPFFDIYAGDVVVAEDFAADEIKEVWRDLADKANEASDIVAEEIKSVREAVMEELFIQK